MNDDTPLQTAVEQAAMQPWWPAWAPWVLWPLVLAVAVVVLTEWIKRALYKREKARFHALWAAQKSHLAKAGLLMPWKAALGTLGGIVLFPEAGLFTSPILAGGAGLLVGAVSFTLYDGLMKVLRFLPEAVQARIGVGTGTAPRGDEGEPR